MVKVQSYCSNVLNKCFVKKEQHIEVHISIITCCGCARGITTAIKELDSNASLDIDLQNRIAEINTTLSQDQLIATLSERGFTADPA